MAEELKKKAIEFIRKTKCNPKDRPDEQIEILHEEELESLIGFATEVTKELEKQIEKMKCCENCKYMNFSEPNYCMKGVYRERQYVCDEWELAE